MRHVKNGKRFLSLVQKDGDGSESWFVRNWREQAIMKTRIAARATALVLSFAWISSAMAYDSPSRYTSFSPY
ncbi:hypothetical protein FVA95_30535, partial [Pseudonocardia sp. EV170527-09]|uniref:hypothetical protein n=1 Tax=Pseudonocardia sp. EV170527-09 TaxID=2603411 RepID=UPI00125C9670